MRRLPHRQALEEAITEGIKVVRSELEHFLEVRERVTYLAALKAAAISARWREIRGAIGAARGTPVNDATVRNVLEKLKAAMLIDERGDAYSVSDLMLRTLLLTM